MIDISIIIVSWNAKEFLYKCLKSIPAQINGYQLEIIVIDNASTDGSPELIEKKFSHIRLIRNDNNLGFAKANNIGIYQSIGRYVCLINSDVIVLEDCISSMCTYMDNHPEIGILGPKVLNPDGTLQFTCRKFPTLWDSFCRTFALDKLFPKSKIFGRQFMSFWSHDKIHFVDYLSGCFMLIRRSALDNVGLFDESFFFYAEDKDLCKRFWDAGWNVVYFPRAEAIHYLYGSSNRDPIKFYIQEIKANLQYYKKHKTQISSLLFLIISIIHQVIRILGSTLSYVIKPSERKYKKLNIKRSFACICWLLRGAN